MYKFKNIIKKAFLTGSEKGSISFNITHTFSLPLATQENNENNVNVNYKIHSIFSVFSFFQKEDNLHLFFGDKYMCFLLIHQILRK